MTIRWIRAGLPVFILVVLSGCAGSRSTPSPSVMAPAETDWSRAPIVAVALTDFKFTPSRPSFVAGQPARLALTNSGSDRHDFSAPEFFAAARLRQGGTMPKKGDVILEKGQSAEIDLIPGAAGQYELECTEFLHAMFGMSGGIDVVAAAR